MTRSLLLTAFFSSLVFAAENIASVKLDDGIEIIPVEDLSNSMDISLFDGGPLSKEQKLAYMPDGKAKSSVNVFLVKTGNKTYLVDAGFGNAVADKRIDPSKIDGVLLTHAHGDHISGLLKDGKANFSSPVFISKPENDYWQDSKTPNSELQKSVAKVYAGRYKSFAFGDTLAPGIVAVEATGHTPGHTAFLIGTGKNKLLIAGDFLHAAALQFPHPEESARYDVDPKKSVETRKKLMKTAEENGWFIAGMHIPFPGIGKVVSRGSGYTFQ